MQTRCSILTSFLIPAATVFAFLGLAPQFLLVSSASNLPPFLFTSAPKYDSLSWIHGDERFTAGATLFVQDTKGAHVLLPEFAASADPAISFDGKRVLFAGKDKVLAHWQIWEVDLSLGRDSVLDHGAPRRITSCAEDCIRPFYLSNNRVVYAKKATGRFIIEAADFNENSDTRAVVQLTYGPGNSLPTDVLRDGRILFEAAYPLGSNRTAELYTVYSDGSGVEAYRCDHGNARYSGREVKSGDIVFTSASGLRRFTSARAREIQIDSPPGDYAGELAETPAGEWMFPWRPHNSDYFKIARWKPGDPTLQSVAALRSANAIQPTPVVEHIVPNRHPSGLHDWTYANLLCLNAYTSKYAFAPGSIRAVRLYIRTSAGVPKLLGTSPVERDGSFFVQVPSERPLQVELLDASGKTLKRELGWFWMKAGEQRGCVGCHAGPETAPENAVPLVLLKSTTPASMLGDASAVSGGH